MNKYLARTLAAATLVGPLLAGCESNRNWIDPCWPERYSHTARKEVVDAFAPQVQNGHILDQTVWNYEFATGTDELNGYGKYKLDYMIRRRPAPDGNIFLQTAHDVTYNPDEPDKLAESRRELDLRRIAAIQRYLNAQTVGRPMQFEVAVHDPYMVGENAAYAAGSLRIATSAATGLLASGVNTTGTSSPDQLGVPAQQNQQNQQGGNNPNSGYVGGAGSGGSGGSTTGGGASGTQPR